MVNIHPTAQHQSSALRYAQFSLSSPTKKASALPGGRMRMLLIFEQYENYFKPRFLRTGSMLGVAPRKL